MKIPNNYASDSAIPRLDVVSDHQWFSVSVFLVSVFRGGHTQIISGTECHTEKDAQELLEALADDLKSGKWTLGTKDGRAFLKRVQPFAPVKLNVRPLVSA